MICLVALETLKLSNSKHHAATSQLFVCKKNLPIPSFLSSSSSSSASSSSFFFFFFFKLVHKNSSTLIFFFYLHILHIYTYNLLSLPRSSCSRKSRWELGDGDVPSWDVKHNARHSCRCRPIVVYVPIILLPLSSFKFKRKKD